MNLRLEQLIWHKLFLVHPHAPTRTPRKESLRVGNIAVGRGHIPLVKTHLTSGGTRHEERTKRAVCRARESTKRHGDGEVGRPAAVPEAGGRRPGRFPVVRRSRRRSR